MSYSHCISPILSDFVCLFCRSFSFLRKFVFFLSLSSLFCQSFFLFITSLLYISLSKSYSHCTSSILSDFVCLLCCSFSILRQFVLYFLSPSLCFVKRFFSS